MARGASASWLGLVGNGDEGLRTTSGSRAWWIHAELCKRSITSGDLLPEAVD